MEQREHAYDNLSLGVKLSLIFGLFIVAGALLGLKGVFHIGAIEQSIQDVGEANVASRRSAFLIAILVYVCLGAFLAYFTIRGVLLPLRRMTTALDNGAKRLEESLAKLRESDIEHPELASIESTVEQLKEMSDIMQVVTGDKDKEVVSEPDLARGGPE
jgi:hypothetical protein